MTVIKENGLKKEEEDEEEKKPDHRQQCELNFILIDIVLC